MTADRDGATDAGAAVDGGGAGSPDDLVVSEVFGPTFQGEGPSTGHRAAFVRLGRCNLTCTWCDTPYTWDWERFDPSVELSRRTVAALLAEIEAMAPEIVVVTGGEPLLQQRRLVPLVAACAERGLDTMLTAARAMAKTGGEFLVDEGLQRAVRAAFERR